MATRTAGASNEIGLRRRNKEHEQVLNELREQFEPVFLHSLDGVYLYLDDNHKICNKRLADMFGLTEEEFSRTPGFLEHFVALEDRGTFATNYQKHVTMLSRPKTFRFQGVRKNGETFKAETEMIPISWNGHAVAYHFVREIK